MFFSFLNFNGTSDVLLYALLQQHTTDRKSSLLKITFNFKLEFQLRKIRFGAVSIQFKVMLKFV